MVGKKRCIFKRLKKESLRWKYLWSAFKSKTLTLPVSFLNDAAFMIASAIETILLLLSACFFYLFCGCRF